MCCGYPIEGKVVWCSDLSNFTCKHGHVANAVFGFRNCLNQ